MLPRIGDEHQVQIPPLLGEINCISYTRNSSYTQNESHFDHKFFIGLLIPIWVSKEGECIKQEKLELPSEPKTIPDYGPSESKNIETAENFSHNENVGINIGPSHNSIDNGGPAAEAKELPSDEKLSNCSGQGFLLLPGLVSDCFSDIEKEPFLLARRTKGRKWRCNLQPRNRQERLNYSKKWKLEAVIQNSSEKCMACRMSVLGDNSLAEGSAVLAAADVDNKKSFSGGDVYESSLIDIENVDVNTKETVVTCSCSALDTVGIHKEVEGDCYESGATLDSLSDTAKVLDEGSSSATSNSIMKSKRHSEKDLDNLKPTKSRRPTNEPLYLSCQYSKISFCGVDDHLPDGFFDAGRDRPFMPL
ncbi:Leucine-rich repeat protein kinase family protein [Abeliophyllum distichum]|uniref:Leucine-rich repeat protein kinase family protein n=1 Tax=Abeliophyllum distichum TaxID=126358 RepID=A0ABD1VAK8_9LAMI